MEKKSIIESFTWVLAGKPIIGSGTSISAGMLAFIEVTMPYLQFFSIILGISIGILTLYWLLNKDK